MLNLITLSITKLFQWPLMENPINLLMRRLLIS
jgi:hypothetical protein